jgi:hypothetical protein
LIVISKKVPKELYILVGTFYFSTENPQKQKNTNKR